MNSNRNPDEKNVTLRVPGDLISTTTEALRNDEAALFGASDTAPLKWDILTLDLTAAKMVDSAGLNLVVSLLKRVQRRGAKMQIAYSSPNILRTLTFTRLDKHVGLVKV